MSPPQTSTQQPAAESQAATAAPSRLSSRWRRALLVLVVAYSITIAGIWVWMLLAGPNSWAITFLLFGPRWLCGLPLLVLVPAAAIWHRRLLWLLGATTLVLLGPVLGFEPHFLAQEEVSGVRVLTCNLDTQKYDVARLTELIANERPDVVALQEAKIMPPAIVWPRGWHFVHHDELIVASRWPIAEKEMAPRPIAPAKPAGLHCVIQMPRRELQFFVLHLLTPRPGLEAVLNKKTGIDLSRVDELKQALARQAEDSQAVSDFVHRFPGGKIVAGDFNMPVESPFYREQWADLENAFSAAGFGFGFSKLTEEEGWTYGTRIDHLLYTPPWRCTRAWLGADIGSDHLPLVADFLYE